MQQRLVVARHRRRGHDRATAGHAGRAHGGLVEANRVDCRRVVRPCRASRRVRCRPVPPAGIPSRRGSASGAQTRSSMTSRKSASPLRRSISSASTQCADSAWYSKRVPGSHSSSQSVKRLIRVTGIGALDRIHRRVRKPGGVQQHLLDGDVLLAVARELRHVVRDRARDVEHAVADQQPDRRRDDRLRRGEEHEARVVGRVAERLEAQQLAVARDRDLARGRCAVGDELGRGVEELVMSADASDSQAGESCMVRSLMATICVTGSAGGIGSGDSRPAGDMTAIASIGVDVRDAEVIADLSTPAGRAAMVDAVDERDATACSTGWSRARGSWARARSSRRSTSSARSRRSKGCGRCCARGTDAECGRDQLELDDASRRAFPTMSSTLLLAGDEPAALAAVDNNKFFAYMAAEARARALGAAARDASRIGSAPGIRLNAIAPGVIETPMTANDLDFIMGMPDVFPVPIGRPGRPEEIADFLAFLLSPDAQLLLRLGAVLRRRKRRGAARPTTSRPRSELSHGRRRTRRSIPTSA